MPFGERDRAAEERRSLSWEAMDFGAFGAWTSFHRIGGEDNAAEAAAAAEAAGLATFWLGGSPRLAQLRGLLEGSERLVVATSVVNIWSYDPADLAREFVELEADFPGRVCVGIGVGHPEATSDYARPLSALESFLDGVEAAPTPVPVERRIIAALGPKMLAMSARRSLGTIPYFSSVDHTRAARAAVGPDALVIPEVAYVLDEDVERARATAREYASLYLALSNYTKALVDHGFERADLEDGGSDRLIDHVIPHGSAAEVAATVRAHVEAGADHVALQALGADGIPSADWAALAAALA
jgi:probable F420-dependent oxidoreductase